MIRILLFLFLFLGFAYILIQIFNWFKYRGSVYYKVDQDVLKLNEEMNRYKKNAAQLEQTKRDLWQSYSSIKHPPNDVKELFDLRTAVINKEINLYQKIISLYEQYQAALKDKAQVMRFKEKHGDQGSTAEDISDALFQVEQMRNEIKTNLKVSYYDQISGPTEMTDLKGSLKHLEEMEKESKALTSETPESLENEIQDDFLVLKELVRQKL